MSLDRQIRIVIGALVLTGSALAWFHHPYWIGLPAFMGASLIFSGLADFCGLALILGRMPWNQVTPQAGEKSVSSGASCSTKSCSR